MKEDTFWSMIEDAWRVVEGKAELRFKLAVGEIEDPEVDELLADLEKVIPALRSALEKLDAEQLIQCDHLLERKLYDLDRAEIFEQIGGSEDGFLYARGFIVAMGRGYYDAVNDTPSFALPDAECEAICFLPTEVYEERFGEMPASPISRETHSNTLGWPERPAADSPSPLDT